MYHIIMNVLVTSYVSSTTGSFLTSRKWLQPRRKSLRLLTDRAPPASASTTPGSKSTARSWSPPRLYGAADSRNKPDTQKKKIRPNRHGGYTAVTRRFSWFAKNVGTLSGLLVVRGMKKEAERVGLIEVYT